LGGAILLKKYGSSPFVLLSNIFPEHEWFPWKFSKIPRNTWQDPKNIRDFLNWAEKALRIKDPSDWYKVSRKVKFST
jgi:hypothetical protein